MTFRSRVQKSNEGIFQSQILEHFGSIWIWHEGFSNKQTFACIIKNELPVDTKIHNNKNYYEQKKEKAKEREKQKNSRAIN